MRPKKTGLGDGHSSFPGKGGFCFHVYLLLIDCFLLFCVSFDYLLLIVKHHCWYKGCNIKTFLGQKRPLSREESFRATPAVTQDLSSAVSIEGQPLLHSSLLRQARSIKDLILSGLQIYRS